MPFVLRLPKKGKKFPITRRSKSSAPNCANAIGHALKSELGGTHRAVKTIMRWTHANERTVKYWLAGQRCPRCEHLIEVIRHSDAICAVILQLAGRDQLVAAIDVANLRRHLVAALAEIEQSVRKDCGGPR